MLTPFSACDVLGWTQRGLTVKNHAFGTWSAPPLAEARNNSSWLPLAFVISMLFCVTDVAFVKLSRLVRGLDFDRHTEDGNQVVKASQSQRNGSCKQDTANKREYLSVRHSCPAHSLSESKSGGMNSPHSNLMIAMQNKDNKGYKANTKDRASHRSKKCPEQCAALPWRTASAPLQSTTAQWTHPNTHRLHWDHP